MILDKVLSSLFHTSDFCEILEIANIIEKNNGSLYLVGGCVRDIFLKVSPKDYDFCITGLNSNLFELIFPKAKKQGKDFPVYILNNHEFALARKERSFGVKHTDFNFDFSPDITIYEDLQRRDLTINSIAINVLTCEVIDPYNGIGDIQNKVLKATSSAFSEDPLRVYRVARFASQLNFKLYSETKKMMSDMKNNLQVLSPERVFNEFRKALNSDNPSKFFKILKECECLTPHFNIPLNLQLLEDVSEITNDELIRFAALTIDSNNEKIREFCNNLKMPTSFKKAACTAIKLIANAINYNTLSSEAKIDFFEKVYKSKVLTIKGIEIIANAKLTHNTLNFAEIGEKIMKNIKLNNDDLIKLSKIKKANYTESVKALLLNKRLQYLHELESSNLPN